MTPPAYRGFEDVYREAWSWDRIGKGTQHDANHRGPSQPRHSEHHPAHAGKEDAGAIEPGHGLKLGYFAQEHDTIDGLATVWENIRHAAPDTGDHSDQILAELGYSPADIASLRTDKVI